MSTGLASSESVEALAPPRPASKASAWLLLAALLLVNVLCQVDRVLPFVLAESMARELGLSDTQLGLVVGVAFTGCYALMALPLALAADRGSPRLVLVSCILVWSFMTSVGGMVTSFAGLVLSRIGVAFGEAGATPAAHALIARKVGAGRRGLALGIFSMGLPLGAMVGFAAGGAIGDAFGWRTAFLWMGTAGAAVALLAFVAVGRTPAVRDEGGGGTPFFRASLALLSLPAFRWLFIGAIAISFAAAPFNAFATSFLSRIHGYSAAEAGLAFGLLQGLMGIAGALAGGQGFDRVAQAGSGSVLRPPAVLILVASATTAAALFAPVGWLAIALLVPGMLSFSFMLPWAFGAAHLVAGPGRQAMASGLVVLGASLIGPGLSPVLVGLISDAASAAQVPGGIRLGLLVVPVAGVVAAMAMLVANRRIERLVASHRGAR